LNGGFPRAEFIAEIMVLSEPERLWEKHSKGRASFKSRVKGQEDKTLAKADSEQNCLGGGGGGFEEGRR
jgi:hypothetical protein